MGMQIESMYLRLPLLFLLSHPFSRSSLVSRIVPSTHDFDAYTSYARGRTLDTTCGLPRWTGKKSVADIVSRASRCYSCCHSLQCFKALSLFSPSLFLLFFLSPSDDRGRVKMIKFLNCIYYDAITKEIIYNYE